MLHCLYMHLHGSSINGFLHHARRVTSFRISDAPGASSPPHHIMHDQGTGRTHCSTVSPH